MWVDPLDGTREYTQGPEVNHEVTVLIGVSWKGSPIAGVVNQPFYRANKSNADSLDLGRVLWGIVGVGAFDSSRGQITLPVRQPEDPKVRRIVTTRSHITDIIKRDLTSIPNTKLIHSGGAGFKVVYQPFQP